MPRIRITLEAALRHVGMSGRELERRTGVHRDTIGKHRHNEVRIISLDILERRAFGDSDVPQVTPL